MENSTVPINNPTSIISTVGLFCFLITMGHQCNSCKFRPSNCHNIRGKRNIRVAICRVICWLCTVYREAENKEKYVNRLRLVFVVYFATGIVDSNSTDMRLSFWLCCVVCIGWSLATGQFLSKESCRI